MATIYSDVTTDSSGAQFRAAFTYSTSTANNEVTISGTVYLQHKGSAYNDTYFGERATAQYKSSKLDFWVTIVDTGDLLKSCSAHSSWTNVKSATGSVTLSRDKSAYTVTIGCGTGWLTSITGGTGSVSVPALPSYTVSYNANGGSTTPSSQTKWYGETLTLQNAITHASTSPGNYTVTLNGNGITNPTALTSKRTVTYSFNVWKATNGTTYAAVGSYTANAATTMTAQWNTTETRAAVTFPSPTRTDYAFKRWNTNTSDTGTGYNGGSTLAPTGNMTVYAIWNPKIAYNANGGTGAPATQTKTFGSTLNLQSSTPTRTGHTFSKWNSAANGSGTDYQPSQTLAANDNTAKTLYAQWTANTYTISFNANGGTNAPSSISKTYGQSVTLPSSKPTRVGHTFLGWASSSSAATAQWLAGATFSEAITSDTTLYAVWRDDYEAPSITTLRAYRCGFELTTDTAIDPDKTYYTRSGESPDYVYTEVSEPDVSEISTYYELIDDDEAGYARVEADWSIDTTVDEGVVNTATMTGTITPEGQQAQSITFDSGYQGTSGTAIALISGLDVDTQYTITVTVTDVKGASRATSRTVLLLRAFYIFDFGSQGNAVGIGRAAPQSGMEVGYPATFDDYVNLYDELQFNGEQAYPTFSKSQWSTSSDESTLPVTPCFVLSTGDGALYWCSGSGIVRMNITPHAVRNVGANLNDMKLGDTWWGNEFTNAPDNGWYEVYFHGLYQVAYGFTGNTAAPMMYLRSYVNNVWQPWVRVDSAASLPLSGGTLSGNLAIANTAPYIVLKDTDLESNVTTSGESNYVYFQDKNGTTIGRVNTWIDSGVQYMRYITQRYISSLSATKYNILNLGIDASGNAKVSLGGTNAAAAWRSAIGALSTSGGTLTGVLSIKDSTIDRDGTLPSSQQWASNNYHFSDKSGEDIGTMTVARETDGRIRLRLGPRNENSSGNTVQNNFDIIVAKDGTQTYAVSNKDNFRSAIGAAASSDRRLKSDISALGEDAVEFIEALEPCVYVINGERQVGLIAQDVHGADPWGTRMAFETREGIDGLDDWEKMEDGSPTWKLDYIRVIPPLVAAVQAANRRIESLETEVAELRALVDKLLK